MAQPQSTLERIVSDWTAAAGGWRRWEAHNIAYSWPVTHRIVDALNLSPGQSALDVGCGIGDPVIAIAEKIGETGRVIAIDPVAEMVETARARAAGFGLTNIEFHTCPIEELTLADGSLDAASGRWSFIFCEDVVAALRSVRAWLKPGGRFAMATWTPQENSPGFKIINTALNRQVNLPPLDATKPCMAQLSEPGQLEGALSAAGFKDIRVQPVRLSIFATSGAEFWEMMSQMGGSLRKVYNGLKDDQRAAVAEEVIAGVEQFRSADVLRIPALAQVGSATA